MSNITRTIRLLVALVIVGVAVYYRDVVWVCLQLFVLIVVIPVMVLMAVGIIGEETANALLSLPGQAARLASKAKEEWQDAKMAYEEKRSQK